jgi:uncharacterized membrane protein
MWVANIESCRLTSASGVKSSYPANSKRPIAISGVTKKEYVMLKYYGDYIGIAAIFLLGLANWHGVKIGNNFSMFAMVFCFALALIAFIMVIFD